MSIMEFVIECVLEPMLDFFAHKSLTGKKDYTCFLPVVVVVCALLFVLGLTWNVAILSVIGGIGFLPSLILSIFCSIRRDKEEWEEFRCRRAAAKKKKKDTKAEQ